MPCFCGKRGPSESGVGFFLLMPKKNSVLSSRIIPICETTFPMRKADLMMIREVTKVSRYGEHREMIALTCFTDVPLAGRELSDFTFEGDGRWEIWRLGFKT